MTGALIGFGAVALLIGGLFMVIFAPEIARWWNR